MTDLFLKQAMIQRTMYSQSNVAKKHVTSVQGLDQKVPQLLLIIMLVFSFLLVLMQLNVP